MDVVGAFACSHAGFLISDYERAEPTARERVYAGFARMREAIRAMRPDALVVIATDHGRVYPLNHQPQYVIGVGSPAHGIGDAGLPECSVPVNQAVAKQMLEGCIEAGVDLAYAESVSIDHSFVTPLMLATPDLDVPIVPIVQNTRMPPMPTLRRSYDVGRLIGEVLRCAPGEDRVVVLGTGGLSHWVGDEARRGFLRRPAGTRFGHEAEFPLVLGERGAINEQFDREFLETLEQGRAGDFAREWNNEQLEAEAGNGGFEVRNWLIVAGAAQDAPLEVLAYAPVPEWHTGTAVGQFHLN
jgi:2,3-dihydroxyphenylpropionate 1,2-dioxygenase